MVSVIFPAAGQGRRMRAGRNKVLLTLGGEPILVRTLRQFARVPAVGECIVVAGAQETAEVEAMLAAAGFGEITTTDGDVPAQGRFLCVCAARSMAD